MSFVLRGLSSFRVSFIRGFTVGRYQRDVVGKGVCMRVERVGGEEVWFLFDFCNADAQTVISFLKTCRLDKGFKVFLFVRYGPIILQEQISVYIYTYF